MKTILEVNNISKSYGKKKILKDVSFSLCEGEILGFIGPNGAGKTTTIKLILGLQSIDSGNVKINGYDVKKDFVKAISNVGAIVENPDLYMYLSGRKNLEMVASYYKNVSKKRINDVIDLVGLNNRIDDKVSKYSLGMRQRLGIAAALINSPSLLILDEPTNGLDPEGIKELRNLLQKLAKVEGIGVLISSHNLAELESFCTDICIIKNGEIVSTDTIKNIKVGASTSYILDISKTTGIKSLLEKNDEILDSNTIMVYRDRDGIAKLVNELVQKGILIYEVKLNEMTLEEAFLEKAGGNLIV